MRSLILFLCGLAAGVVVQAQSVQQAPGASAPAAVTGGAFSPGRRAASPASAPSAGAAPASQAPGPSAAAAPARMPVPGDPLPSPAGPGALAPGAKYQYRVPDNFGADVSRLNSGGLSAEEIRRQRLLRAERDQAGMAPLSPQPTSVGGRKIDLRFEPGAPDPVINVALGRGAVVMFRDRRGNPWPLASGESAGRNFDDGVIEVHELGGSSSDGASAVTVSYLIKDSARPSRFVVMLRDYPQPVWVDVVPAVPGGNADVAVTLSMPVSRPGLEVGMLGSAGSTPPKFGLEELASYAVLQPPSSARALKVIGSSEGDVMAWQAGSQLIVRVREGSMLVAPGWTESYPSGIHGVVVFRAPMSARVTVYDRGRTSRSYSLENWVPTASVR